MLDEDAFAVGLAALARALGGKVDAQVTELYYVALQDLDEQAWQRATARALRELKFFPRPAELRELAGEHSSNDRVIAAWTEAMTAAASVGGWSSVDFEDPAINAAVRSMGGWIRFCGRSSDELERFGRKNFEQAYRAYAKSCTEEAAAPLPGLAALGNGAQGIVEARPPRRIPATTALVGGGPRMLGPGSGSGGPTLIGGGR